jgi:serine/threonine protein kinase
LSHPNVVRFFGLYISEKGEKYLVMEFLSKGSLSDFLSKPGIEEALTTSDLLFMYALSVASINGLCSGV